MGWHRVFFQMDLRYCAVQTLAQTRQVIRELVQANSFIELTRCFDSLEAQWRQAAPGEFPAYLAAIEGHMLVDLENQGDRALSQVLKAWIDACPKAYHPQVVMGMHCFHRACQVQDGANATLPACWPSSKFVKPRPRTCCVQWTALHNPWQRPLACCVSVRNCANLAG